jgi:aminopeptidase N
MTARVPFAWSLSVAFAVLILGTAAFSAEQPGTDETFPRGKLPASVTPESYRLRFEIDPTRPEFSGMAEIALRLSETTRRIWLHGNNLAVAEATLEVDGQTRPAGYTQVDPVSGVARIDLDEDAVAGPATLRIRYTAPFNTGAEGLFREQVGEDWYVFSQMEPIDARRAFPGFDEPRFKTPFEVTVITPASNKVIANAPLATMTPEEDGRVKHVFAPTLPLPTYLVALAVGPLEVVGAPSLPPTALRSVPLPLRGITRRGQGQNLAYALKETPELIRRFEDYFGIAYPYPKLDLIASTQMAGAMENAGAILFGENLILLAPDAPLQQIRSFGIVNAHEISHHWFGDLVTPVWWDDIWLNESFAEWAGVKIAQAWRPDLGVSATLTIDSLYAMNLDSQLAGRPVHEPIDDNTRINSTFDAITYLKGGGVLAMFESYLGEDVFRRGIQQHLRAHQHGNADAQDFFRALADAAHQPALVEAFRSFIDQPGVPLVAVRLAADGKRIELAQSRYRPVGSKIAPGAQWKIPFCATLLADSAPQKVCTLMSGEKAALELPAGLNEVAILPNAAGAGYYRFSLEPAALRTLLARANSLSEGEGLALADSIVASFKAGGLTLEQLLSAARSLSTHPARQVATATGVELVKLKDRLLDSAQRQALEHMLADIYKPRLQELGLDARAGVYDGRPADERLLRQTLVNLVAVHAHDPGTRHVLARAARASLDQPEALDPGFRQQAWTVAVQEDGKAFADELLRQLPESDDGLWRNDAAEALGAAEDPEVARKARAFVLDERARVDEVFAIVYAQFASPVTRDETWTWYQQNIRMLFDRLPGFARTATFDPVSVFCDAPHRASVEQYLTPKVRELGTGELELARALESIDLCVALKKSHSRDIATTLARPAAAAK